MPKLPALTGDAVINTLKKVGFQVVRQKGSTYVWNMKMDA
ncbi:MAG: type II toxin-antitoxin system HicA family toxin [Hassallia sp.]